MADYLVIKLPPETGDPAQWIVVDSNGHRRTELREGALEEAAEAARECAVIGMVPGHDVLTATVDLPIKSGARLRAAVPYALEDNLASDVEDLHFATGTNSPGGLIRVAVVAHELMEGWIARLHEAGIYPSRLVPDYHGVQSVPNSISLVAAGDDLMFNDGNELECTVEGVQPSDALALAGLLEEGESEESEEEEEAAEGASRHLVAWCDEESADRFTHDFNALRNELDSVDVNVMREGAMPRLAATLATGAGINLLQGPYGKKTEFAAVFRPWRLAASLLIGVFVLGLAAKGVDYVQLSRQQEALQAQYAALYQTLRPGDSRVPADPIGAADSVLRQLVGNSAGPTQVFLPSLMQLAEALNANEDANVQAVSYRAGVIDVRLTAPNVATLDRIQKSVSDSGRFSASIQDTNNTDGKVSSRIQIRETGA